MSLLSGYTDVKVFRPLAPGIHEVKILALTEGIDVNGEPYVRVSFAPTANLEHGHSLLLYRRVIEPKVGDPFVVDELSNFGSAMIRATDYALPNVHAALNQDFSTANMIMPMLLEPYSSVGTDGKLKTGFNWRYDDKHLKSYTPTSGAGPSII
jgi:hypothetical protein